MVCYVKLKMVLYFYLLGKVFGKIELVLVKFLVFDYLCLVNFFEILLDYFKNVLKIMVMEIDIN